MRTIKYRYRFDRGELMEKVASEPRFITEIVTLEELENGAFDHYYGNYKILSRDLSTGLHDRNGEEIFEGDVVAIPYIDPMGELHIETTNSKSKVGFENGQFVIYQTEPQALVEWCEKKKGEYISNYGNLTTIKDKTFLEILGNLHEHPHLLTNN